MCYQKHRQYPTIANRPIPSESTLDRTANPIRSVLYVYHAPNRSGMAPIYFTRYERIVEKLYRFRK